MRQLSGYRDLDFELLFPVDAMDGKLAPLGAEALGVNAADRLWVNRQTTVQPVACFQQPVQLTGGLERVKQIAYI
jgi:hypothetical protein